MFYVNTETLFIPYSNEIVLFPFCERLMKTSYFYLFIFAIFLLHISMYKNSKKKNNNKQTEQLTCKGEKNKQLFIDFMSR